MKRWEKSKINLKDNKISLFRNVKEAEYYKSFIIVFKMLIKIIT